MKKQVREICYLLQTEFFLQKEQEMNSQMGKPFFAYRSFWKDFETVRRFAETGVKEYCVFAGNTANSLGEPYSQYETVWKWFDAYDFTPFEEQMTDLLRIVPDARVICLIDLNSPLWLARQMHLDSYFQLGNALANQEWRKRTEQYVSAFTEYAQKNYGERIIAYVLMCGKTDEWMDHANGDETVEKLLLYQEWCRQNGFPVPNEIPSVLRRENAPWENGKLRDPVQNVDAVRYWKFNSEFIADGILHFAALVRQFLREEQKIGVFYGYILELGALAVSLGHLAYEKLEASSLIDFLISPGDYGDREMGGGSGFMTPNGTLHLHGKGCLYEIDHRTHTANMKLTPYVELQSTAWRNLTEDIAGMKREFCRTLFHGSSLWWFNMWGGFYSDPRHFETIRQCRMLWEKYADPTFQPEAETALIVDPENALLLHDEETLIYRQAQNALNRMGTPYLIYSLNDLPSLPPSIRLLIFAVMPEITPEKRNFLEQYAFPGRHCCWYGPCGLTDGNGNPAGNLPGTRIRNISDFTPEFLRSEAKAAGVHFYTDMLCPVWAGRNLLSIHTAQGGRKTISLKRKTAQVTELFSGAAVAEECSSFDYHFKAPDTVLFYLN